MKSKRRTISDAEQQVLQSLWELGPTLVRDITAALNQRRKRWERTTVITLLQRLEKKGFVASDKSGHAFIFRAVATREELAQQRIRQLADDLFDGSPAPLMLSFVEQHDFTEKELAQLRKLIDQAKSRTTKNDAKRK